MTQDTERAQASLRRNETRAGLKLCKQIASPVESVVHGALIDRHLVGRVPEVSLVLHQAVHHSQPGHRGQNLQTFIRGSRELARSYPDPGRDDGTEVQFGLVLVPQVVEDETEDETYDVGLEPSPGHQVEVLHVVAAQLASVKHGRGRILPDPGESQGNNSCCSRCPLRKISTFGSYRLK